MTPNQTKARRYKDTGTLASKTVSKSNQQQRFEEFGLEPLVPPPEPYQTQTEALEQKGGHGNLKATTFNGKPTITKPTNLTEVVAYIELGVIEKGAQQSILPNIYNITVIDKNTNKSLYNFDPSQSSYTELYNFLMNAKQSLLKNQNKYNVMMQIERLEHKGPQEEFGSLTSKVLDVKIGKKIYSNSEADYNGNKHKNPLNKLQMSFTEWLARKGGAQHFQIADAINPISRTIRYYNSCDNYLDYVNQFNPAELALLKVQLQNIHSFVKDHKVAAVGASLLYVGNQVRLIDPAHYLSKINPNAEKPQDYEQLHENLLDAIDEQMNIIDFIHNHKLEHTNETLPIPTPFIEHNQAKSQQNQLNNTNNNLR